MAQSIRAAVTTSCGCGAVLPRTGGPTHRYIVSTSECWSAYGTVLAREYENAVLFGAVHQLTVAAYSTQHPVGQPPKSLLAQLVAMHALVGRGSTHADARDAVRKFVTNRTVIPDLSPPADLGPLTVVNAANAATPDCHIATVRAWAGSVWHRWAAHHALIAELAGD